MNDKNKQIINEPVRVGVTGVIVRNRKILLGLRGDGCETAKNEFALPGGRMDFGEHPLSTLVREIDEETTIRTKKEDAIFMTYSHELFPKEHKHYESLVFIVWVSDGDPELTEPDKCKEWRWVDPHNLPSNTFAPAKKTITEYISAIDSAMDAEEELSTMKNNRERLEKRLDKNGS